MFSTLISLVFSNDHRVLSQRTTRLRLLYLLIYWHFWAESIAWKTYTEIFSSNHYRESTFSHVEKVFHPIRNRLSKWISQFTRCSRRCCWHLFNLYSQTFVEFPQVYSSLLQFTPKWAINHWPWRNWLLNGLIVLNKPIKSTSRNIKTKRLERKPEQQNFLKKANIP